MSPDRAPELPERSRVTVWSIDLREDPSAPPAVHSLLTVEESRRASRFHFDRDRRRYVAAHAAMRTILGWELGVPASAVQWVEGRWGKPRLAPESVHFNLAHSEDLALVAVSHDAPVGIDVEKLLPLDDPLDLARGFFASGEREWLERTEEPHERLESFYRCWTRKEAFLKGVGKGLSDPLDAFEVEFRTDAASPVLHTDGERTGWTTLGLEISGPYIGSLALPVSPERLPRVSPRRFRWDGGLG